MEAGSPSSGEMMDPEDFRRKILEILSDPSDNPEQMKRLFKAVIEAKGKVIAHNPPILWSDYRVMTSSPPTRLSLSYRARTRSCHVNQL